MIRSFYKITADYIFDGIRFLPPQTTLIYTADGEIIELLPEKLAGEEVRKVDGIVCPGFINTHCHLELSHLKEKIEEGLGLPRFLLQVITQRHMSSMTIMEQSMEEAARSMYASGTAAVGDIVNTTYSIKLKKNTPLYTHSFVEAVGFDATLNTKKLRSFTECLTPFQKEKLPSSMALHAPYSLSDEMLTALLPILQDNLTSMHNQECAAENDLYLHKKGSFLDFYDALSLPYHHFQMKGTSSFQYFLPLLAHSTHRLLVHNTFIRHEDLYFFKKQDTTLQDTTFFVLCPRANHYIERTLPPPFLLEEAIEHICIGTDSLASNNDLHLLNELIFLQSHYENIATEHLLRWACYNGARALNIEKQYGKLSKNTRPGIVHIQHTQGKNLTAQSKAQRII